jgi:hypothetical protein
MKKSTLVVVVVGAFVAYRLVWTAAAQPKIEHRISEVALTPNEVAANGPLPGDVTLYQKEFECSQNLPTPGYYHSLNAAEISDAQRSGLFPCATFTGSYDGPNKVYAWPSEDTYQGVSFINNRKPGEL